MAAAEQRDLVIVKAVLSIPQAAAAEGIDRIRDGDEMLEKFGGDVFVDRVGLGQFRGDVEHDQAVGRHPGGAVSLLNKIAVAQRLRAVENTDVIEAKKAAGKEIASGGILPVDPPGEVHQQFLKNAFEKTEIARSPRTGNFINAPRGPGMDGRVHIRKGKFVGWNLAVRMHVPFA